MFKKLKIVAVAMVLTASLIAGILPAHADSKLTNWRKGILVQPETSSDFSSSNFQQSMRNAAADGVNHVTLVIPLRQSTIYSSDIYVPAYTPTDQSLASGIQYVHSLGMQVSLSLHDDPNDNQWRALINPTDRASWFANYTTILDHYADIAQANNAQELLIATEMSSLTIPSYSSANTPGWIAMIQNVRMHFSGLLTYGAEHGGYMADDTQLGFWNYLDEIGISAYYSMGNAQSSVADMETDWANVDNNELKGLATTYNKPLVFIEAGYVSGDNGLGDPGSAYSNPGNVNLTLQANAYQALLAYWSNSSYMRGVSFWDWSIDPNAGGSNDNGYTPQNKPAEHVMKQWFTGNGQTTTGSQPSYPMSVSSSIAVTTGSATTTDVSIGSGWPLYGDLVDVEIYNTSGQQVAQQYYQNQNLGTNSYAINWTPPNDGQYTVKAGIFTANWQSNITWNNSVATLTAAATTLPVQSTPTTPVATSPTAPVTTAPVAPVQPTTPVQTTTPVPTPTPATPVTVTPTPAPTPVTVQPVSNPVMDSIDIWWPSDGSGVSGVQPFKALIDGIDQSSYQMYWQVDGGQLNAMPTSNSGAPHKEADVDLSGWNWHGNGGKYVINFVAKDASGNVLAQKSATITIYN